MEPESSSPCWSLTETNLPLNALSPWLSGSDIPPSRHIPCGYSCCSICVWNVVATCYQDFMSYLYCQRNVGQWYIIILWILSLNFTFSPHFLYLSKDKHNITCAHVHVCANISITNRWTLVKCVVNTMPTKIFWLYQQRNFKNGNSYFTIPVRLFFRVCPRTIREV